MIEIVETMVLEITFTESMLSITNASIILPLLKKAAAINSKDIELNFAVVRSIDSSAINMLVKFYQHLMGSKRTITLTHASPDILKSFEVVKLAKFFKIAHITNPPLNK
jgi:anti-anti-sigma factor